MREKAISRRFLTAITTLFFLGIGICLCQAQEADKQDSTLGELKLQGKCIERLVLRHKNGRTETFNWLEETIKLPVGEYRLQEVRLKGGYTCRPLSVSTRDWITIAEDKPALLRVGAPLKQTVKAQRQGRILVLNYELRCLGGEIYTSSDRNKPPAFTVYKGEKEIASDKFEFG